MAASLLLIATPAGANGGEVDGTGKRYHLTDGWSGATYRSFAYGHVDDQVYLGDWDGSGVDTLAVRRGDVYHFSYRLAGGDADHVVTYGRPDDTVLMGDWNGDGIDTPVVRRGHTYHFKNSLTGGDADDVIMYGRSDDEIIVGDWNGDGRDTLGVRRGNVYHLKNSISGGPADRAPAYGRSDDEILVGDWNGDGVDALGVRRGDEVRAKNYIGPGAADHVMNYGRTDSTPLIGDWGGNGRDTVGLRSTHGTPTDPPIDDMDAYDARMVELINAERAKVGVAPVQLWPGLRPGAQRHSAWMARMGKIEHAPRSTINGDGRAAGCTASGEHIVRTWGYDKSDPRDAMDWYMNSHVHRSGILKATNKYVATGTVEAGNYTYNTQRFARSCS